MRVLGISILVLGLAMSALGASAQSGQTAFTLVAKNQGGAFVWTDETGNQVNPTLTVPASTEVTITIKQGSAENEVGIPHNIKIGQGATSDEITEEGDSLEHKFTSPASGTVDYICAIHPATMKGTLRVAGADGGSGDGGNDSPSVGVVGAVVALAGVALLVARRR